MINLQRASQQQTVRTAVEYVVLCTDLNGSQLDALFIHLCLRSFPHQQTGLLLCNPHLLSQKVSRFFRSNLLSK